MSDFGYDTYFKFSCLSIYLLLYSDCRGVEFKALETGYRLNRVNSKELFRFNVIFVPCFVITQRLHGLKKTNGLLMSHCTVAYLLALLMCQYIQHTSKFYQDAIIVLIIECGR